MALTPVFIVVCSLLVVAGTGKLARPGAQESLHSLGWPHPAVLIRLLGLGEIAIGLWAAISPSTTTGIAVATTYAAFCVFLLVLGRRAEGSADCGCFAGAESPPGALHLTLNAAAVLVGVLVALNPTHGLGWILSRSPAMSFTLIVGTAGAALAAYLAYTLVPAAWRAYGSETGV